ncbi:MAG: DEAD/DEAH box helicase [Archangiaceae bacterium]|nr:DEAD/DEAH box helicase [Archangiaceae bacterium]
MVAELGNLEKALSKAEYGSQLHSLEEVLKGLRSMRLKSIDGLDLATKGKVLTSLLRVGRQPKPADEAPAAPAADAPPAEAPAAEAPAEAAADAPAAEAPAGDAPAADAAAPAEGAAEAPAAPAEAPAAPAAEAPQAAAPVTKLSQWQDVMLLLGRVWRSLGDEEKASRSFEASGRNAPEAEAALPEAPAESGAPTSTSARPARGARPERGPKVERVDRPVRAEKLTPGDWRYKARDIEEKGRTRDAGKMHEEHQSWAEASRLYEVGGDFKSALRNAFRAKDDARVEKLKAHVPADEVPQILEQAQAWEQLMEHHVKTGNYDAVARLYERAKQFDQAALAYERAGKLSLARKAYERAKDLPAANRVRDLEVKKLIERGDRLGAATLLIAASMKDAAIEALKGLPGPKAFRFMQKLKLDAEALALAKSEVEKAVADKAHAAHARWLELLGDTAAAVEAWLLAERKDKALPLLEQLGNWAKAAEMAEQVGQLDKAQELFHRANDKENAERVSKLPRPAVAPAPVPDEPDDDDAKPEAAPA